MRIGTAEGNSTFFSQGLALKAMLEKFDVLRPVEILESPIASTQNVDRLKTGDIDFGFLAANWLGHAKEGFPPFDGPTDLRVVAPMNMGPMFFVALSTSDIQSVRNLRGKRIAVGPKSGGVAQHALLILGALDIGPNDFTPVYVDFHAGANALVAGEVDAQLQRPIPNRIMSELDARADIEVIPYEPRDLEVVIEKSKVYRRATMRSGALKALRRDLVQPGVVNLLVSHSRANREMVRNIASTIFNGAEELVRLNALFAGLPELFKSLAHDGLAGFEFEGVKLHEGARLAYQELGLI
jgi:hypothetical protein